MLSKTQEPALAKWQARISDWLTPWMTNHPVLKQFCESAAVIFYGSLTLGFDDEFADVDLWLLLPDDALAALDVCSPTRFFEFTLDGKKGHMTVHGVSAFSNKVRQCHMDSIFQLRHGVIINDSGSVAADICRNASRSMPSQVKLAFFMHHYIEMRSEHRACDNPMERHDAVALLLSLPKALAHALQAAMILDGEPYPYDKWLYFAGRQTPTGKQLAPHVDTIIDLLGRDFLRFKGSECDHPISNELRNIRRLLIECAHNKGIDEPWLNSWWLHMDEDKRTFVAARWE